MKIEKIRLLQVFGIITGFAGVVVISGVRNISHDDLTGILLTCLATLAFSVGTVLFGGRGKGLRVRDLNLWQSIVGMIVLIPLALAFEPLPTLPSIPAAVSILYLAGVVTIGGMALWFRLIHTDGPAAASAYHLMNPLFGMLLSWAILDIAISARGVVGALVIGLGLFMTMTAQPCRRKADL